MCFALQPRAPFQELNCQKCSGRALFEHLNFQKCSKPGVFCTCWFHLISKCASHHSRMFHPARWLRTRFLASLLSDPPEPEGIEKTVLHDFSNFSRTYSFCRLFSSESLSSLTTLTTVAASVHKSEVWLLNFVPSYLINSHHTVIHASALCIPSHPKTFVTTLCSNSLEDVSSRRTLVSA